MSTGDLQLDFKRFQASSSRFIRDLDRLVEQSARKMAADVVADTARAWPVDSGRSRAAWRFGLQSAVEVNGHLYHEVTVSNAVEYSVWIEYGTQTTAPGEHLQRAIRIAGRRAAAVFGPLVVSAWKGGR